MFSQNGPGCHFCVNFKCHNSIIFHPILTFDHTKMIISSRQIVYGLCLCFLVLFARRHHKGNNWQMDPKPPTKCFYISPSTYSSKSCFLKFLLIFHHPLPTSPNFQISPHHHVRIFLKNHHHSNDQFYYSLLLTK